MGHHKDRVIQRTRGHLFGLRLLIGFLRLTRQAARSEPADNSDNKR